MEIDEYPLLNEPNVMLVALKAAASGPVGTDDCVRRLETSLHQVKVDPLPDVGLLRSRVVGAYRYLRIAGLVETDEEGRFVITLRGRETLRAHPMGIDTSVLVQFPEFRAFIRQPARKIQGENNRAPVAEPQREYDEGFSAGLQGRAITDNPYNFDTIAHLEWENGWCEAHDQG